MLVLPKMEATVTKFLNILEYVKENHWRLVQLEVNPDGSRSCINLFDTNSAEDACDEIPLEEIDLMRVPLEYLPIIYRRERKIQEIQVQADDIADFHKDLLKREKQVIADREVLRVARDKLMDMLEAL